MSMEYLLENNDLTRVVVVLVIASLFVFYCLRRLYSRRRFVNQMNHIPGPDYFPFLGNLREMGFCNSSMSSKVNPSTVHLDLRGGLCSLFRKESMFRVWFGNEAVVFLFGAQTVEPVLNSSVSINKSKFYDLMKPWLGNGLLMRKSEKWRSRRKALTPTFHFRILQDFLPVMNNHSVNLVKKIRETVNEPWIDVVPILTNCTLDIISETAMGFALNCQGNPDTEYAKAVHDATNLLTIRGSNPLLWNNFIYSLTKRGQQFKRSIKVINDLTNKVIQEKKSGSNRSGNVQANGHSNSDDVLKTKKKLAFLDLLLEKHLQDPEFTEQDITDEVNTFMFGGHDTTATSLTWILYLLGQHSDVQEKLHSEVIEVLGENYDGDVTLDHIRDLKYMDMVLKECQRLYPSVPGFAREAEENIKIGDVTIPASTSIFIFTYFLHRDPKVFPNPEVFDPERFSIENSAGRNPYAFIPFSAGPRNCIGQKFALMEEKVVLAHVLRNYKATSLDFRDKVLLSPEVVLRAKDIVRIKFDLRS